MNRSTRLLLIRHAETEWNVGRRLQGQRDSPLTTRGQEQAVGLARRLARLGIHTLYSSDLGRALATCTAITQASGLEPRSDPRLRERSFGVFEGLTWAEIHVLYQLDHEQYLRQSPDWAMPGGESQQQVFDRTLAVLTEIAQHHVGQTVAVVGHGGNLAAAFRAATDLDWSTPRRFSILNASLNILERRHEKWHLVTWGDTSHCE